MELKFKRHNFAGLYSTIKYLQICFLIIPFVLNGQNGKKEAILPARYPGGVPNFSNWLNVKLKPGSDLYSDITGKYYIQFLIDSLGNVKEWVHTIERQPYLDSALNNALSNMLQWSPALKDGKPLTTFHIIQINIQQPFFISVTDLGSYPNRLYTRNTNELNNQSLGIIYPGHKLTKKAEPGFSLHDYLYEMIQYPAVTDTLRGTVKVRFVIEKDGTISQERIVKSLGKAYDDEAIRVIHTMPKWIPGEINGEKVRTIKEIPISFY